MVGPLKLVEIIMRRKVLVKHKVMTPFINDAYISFAYYIRLRLAIQPLSSKH